MSVSFIFTRNAKPGSKLIRWGIGGITSHFAVGFDLDKDNRGVIFHSHFHGLRIEWASEFLQKNDVIYKLIPLFPLQEQAEERLYQAVVRNYGKRYDYKGFLFFTLTALASKIFGSQLKKTNPWGDNKSFLCTEVAEQMRAEIHDIFQVMIPFTRGALTPDQLYHVIKQSKLLQDQRWI